MPDEVAAPAADKTPAEEHSRGRSTAPGPDGPQSAAGKAKHTRGLLDSHFADAAQSIEAPQRAAERSDTEALARAVPSFKSGGSFLGARKLARICGELEKQARSDETQNLPRCIANIQQECEAVRTAMGAVRQVQ